MINRWSSQLRRLLGVVDGRLLMSFRRRKTLVRRRMPEEWRPVICFVCASIDLWAVGGGTRTKKERFKNDIVPYGYWYCPEKYVQVIAKRRRKTLCRVDSFFYSSIFRTDHSFLSVRLKSNCFPFLRINIPLSVSSSTNKLISRNDRRRPESIRKS